MTKLYRPVGLKELELILDSDNKKFPPRLYWQPIFYPVTNFEYAKQIAEKWNTVDEKSGYVGFITEFEVENEYLSKFEKRVVGSEMHCEYWIPAEVLDEFNEKIVGKIVISDAFYGEKYIGLTPITEMLKENSITQQFLTLKKLFDNNVQEYKKEISIHWKLVLANFLLWAKMDFSDEGLT